MLYQVERRAFFLKTKLEKARDKFEELMCDDSRANEYAAELVEYAKDCARFSIYTLHVEFALDDVQTVTKALEKIINEQAKDLCENFETARAWYSSNIISEALMMKFILEVEHLEQTDLRSIALDISETIEKRCKTRDVLDTLSFDDVHFAFRSDDGQAH